MNKLSQFLSEDPKLTGRDVPLYLAPMAGITDWAMRLLCEAQGCNGATTEMISAQGFLSARRSRSAYQKLIARAPFEKSLSVQLFGHEPLYMAEAAHILSQMQRYACVDINMGCPARKVTSGGSGSALMRDERLAGKVIGAVVKASLLPVSVKMRLGWDSEHLNAGEIARIAQEEGASFIAVHGRTTEQQYSGHADWQRIAEIKAAVYIPVIANGDIVDGDSARDALSVTQADGLMIGRAALGNPWVFADVHAALRETSYTPPAMGERVTLARQHARYLRASLPEHRALLEMRKFFAWYIKGMRGAAEARISINRAQSFAEVDEVLDALLKHQDRDPGLCVSSSAHPVKDTADDCKTLDCMIK